MRDEETTMKRSAIDSVIEATIEAIKRHYTKDSAWRTMNGSFCRWFSNIYMLLNCVFNVTTVASVEKKNTGHTQVYKVTEFIFS